MNAVIQTMPQSGVQVRRDEMIDVRRRISGYRFRIISADTSVPPNTLTRVNSLKADNLANFVQRRIAVIALSVDDWCTNEFRQFASPNTIFHIEALPGPNDLARWRDALNQIKALGARVALDSRVVSSNFEEALELADVLFFGSVDYDFDDLKRLIGVLRNNYPRLTFAIDDVHTWEAYRSYLGIGIHYFMGSFLATIQAQDGAPRRALADNVLGTQWLQLPWRRAFECGNEGIDRDHHALFLIATDLLHTMISEKPGGAVKKVIDTLVQEVEQHFQREESILVAAGYPQVIEHAEMHRELSTKVARLVSDFEAEKVEIGSFFQFMVRDLIVKHMLHEDRKFFPIFKNGSTAEPESHPPQPSDFIDGSQRIARRVGQ